MRLLLRIIIFPITLILSILIAFSKFIVTIGGMNLFYAYTNDIRELINDINNIFELIDRLRNTKYEFKIERSYYFI